MNVDEQEAGFRVAVPERVRLLPAEVRVRMPGAGGLDDGDLGALDQAIQGRGRDAVARIGEEAAADPQPVAGAAARPVVELDRLVVDPGNGPTFAGLPVGHQQLSPHHVPIDAPGGPEEGFEACLEARWADNREGRTGDEGAVEDVAGKAEGVVAVEVGQEDDVDRARVDPEPVQVRQQRSAGVEQEVPVDDDPGVVTLERERRSRSQEGEPQAIVTPGLR